MVPVRKRPCRSTLPSLKRVLGSVDSGSQRRVAFPVSKSKVWTPFRSAMTAPPPVRSAIEPIMSGTLNSRRSPVAQSSRWILAPRVSTQYKACSSTSQSGPSPRQVDGLADPFYSRHRPPHRSILFGPDLVASRTQRRDRPATVARDAAVRGVGGVPASGHGAVRIRASSPRRHSFTHSVNA